MGAINQANQAIKNYNMDAVVANELHSRNDRLMIITANERYTIIKTQEPQHQFKLVYHKNNLNEESYQHLKEDEGLVIDTKDTNLQITSGHEHVLNRRGTEIEEPLVGKIVELHKQFVSQSQ